jgi:3'(2'), 5'-bisphosphate nucleotidase
MFDIHQPEIQFALHAVRQAALLAQTIQAEMVTPALTKEDRSPVTVADYAAQALVGALLSETFPDDVVVAEEDAGALRQPAAALTLEQTTRFVRQLIPHAAPESVCRWIDHGRVDTAQRFWTLDPIDGTKGFLRGEQYAVALALVVKGQVQIGVLGCPNLTDALQPDLNGHGSLVIAVRGQGAWSAALHDGRDFHRLKVSSQADARAARLLRSVESGHTNVDQIGAFVQAMGIQARPVSMDSQAKYAVLAAGGGDLLLRLISADKPDYREKIWDQAAGSLILEEAGGQITDLDGRPLDFTPPRSLLHNRGILASNGALHPAALNALRTIQA